MSENFILFLILGVLSLLASGGFWLALVAARNQRDVEITRIRAEADKRVADAESDAILPRYICLLFPDAVEYAWGVEFTLTLNGQKRHLRLTDKVEERVDRLRGSEWKRVKWDDLQSFCEAYYLEQRSQVPPAPVYTAPVAQTVVHAPNGAAATTVKTQWTHDMCKNVVGKQTFTQAEVDQIELHKRFEWRSIGPDEYVIEWKPKNP